MRNFTIEGILFGKIERPILYLFCPLGIYYIICIATMTKIYDSPLFKMPLFWFLLWQGCFKNPSSPLSCQTVSLLFRCWFLRRNPPIVRGISIFPTDSSITQGIQITNSVSHSGSVVFVFPATPAIRDNNMHSCWIESLSYCGMTGYYLYGMEIRFIRLLKYLLNKKYISGVSFFRGFNMQWMSTDTARRGSGD